MALDTLAFRNMSIPLHHVDMTPLTDNPSGNILPVIEIPPPDFNVSFGFDMTGGTSSYRTRNALLLTPRARLVVMADETIDLVNGEMGPLNQLRMTGGASKFHSSSQLPQVLSVGEGHILIDHISLQIFSLMTTLLETTRVVDLRMRPIGRLTRDEIS
jgi:hypothetical protein